MGCPRVLPHDQLCTCARQQPRNCGTVEHERLPARRWLVTPPPRPSQPRSQRGSRHSRAPKSQRRPRAGWTRETGSCARFPPACPPAALRRTRRQPPGWSARRSPAPTRSRSPAPAPPPGRAGLRRTRPRSPLRAGSAAERSARAGCRPPRLPRRQCEACGGFGLRVRWAPGPGPGRARHTYMGRPRRPAGLVRTGPSSRARARAAPNPRNRSPCFALRCPSSFIRTMTHPPGEAMGLPPPLKPEEANHLREVR